MELAPTVSGALFSSVHSDCSFRTFLRYMYIRMFGRSVKHLVEQKNLRKKQSLVNEICSHRFRSSSFFGTIGLFFSDCSFWTLVGLSVRVGPVGVAECKELGVVAPVVHADPIFQEVE